MKIYILTILASLLLSIAAEAQVRVGPFLGYGNGLGLWGLGAYSEVVFSDKASINAVFTQYFPKNLEGIPRRTVWEVNLNGNYYLVSGGVGYLYGLGGFNYTNIKIRTRTALTEEVEQDPNFGLNLGLGTMFRINDLILPFAEGKYTVGGYSQWSVIFGVRFQLGDEDLEDDY
jgi:hypothetical protein